MNTSEKILTLYKCIRKISIRGVLYVYKKLIKPISTHEDTKRHEIIFNIIITTIIFIVSLLDISILYAEITNINRIGFSFLPFSFFILFFVSLLVLSRKGHVHVASYLFIGLYFLATTYGIYMWSIEVPLALLSYGLIIVITSILINSKTGFVVTALVSASIISITYLQTHGIITADLSWRSQPLEFKDAFEDSFVYGAIIIVSWLSNRDLEKSLKRARASEKILIEERNTLEIRIEERTKELKTAQLEKISQLYKFVEFGRLSSGIFHDILNPLTTMALTIEHLQNETSAKNPELDIHIERAIRASKRIESFIQTAKKQLGNEGVEEVFSIPNEISDAVDLLLHKSRKLGVSIDTNINEKILIYGHSVKFFQVIVNLISNALDSYVTKNIDENRKVVVSLFKNENNVVITVQDNGCGIDPIIGKNIFEPFFTTKSKQEGMGLGLSTTRDIVQKSFGGTITFISNLDKGTVFTVSIPIIREAKDRRRTLLR